MRATAGLLAGIALAFGCAAGETGDKACTPGRSIECSGINGCTGAQNCSTDGSGYEPCVCGAAYGGAASSSGGAQSRSSSGGQAQGGSATSGSLGGKAGLGGASQLGGAGLGGAGSGGTASSGGTAAVGGGGSTACKPTDMTGFTYPDYVPARQLRGSCTEQSIRQYYSDCIANDNCAAYAPGAADGKCGACLNPTELDAKAYGPLLKAGNTWFFFYEINVAGCQELVGEVECAPKLQTEFSCRYNSCAGSCPLVDFASFDPLMQCMNQADSERCGKEHAAADCLKDPNSYYSCWGSGYQSQFLAVARVFCL